MRTAKKVGLAIVIGIGGFFAIVVGSVAIWQAYYPEDYAAFKEEREQKDRLERQMELQQADLAKNKKILEAKKELDDYLLSLRKANAACNSVPNSVDLSSVVKDDNVDKVIANAAVMILLIEELPVDYGLLPYKQKISTEVDELINCLNRH